MSKEQLAALLGRPLTTIEDENFKVYLDIAVETLEGILCTSLCDQEDPKVYDVREGYSTVFTDVFTEVSEVQLDGEVIETSKYSIRQWNKRNAEWYNSIVFDDKFTSDDVEVSVSATWGFDSYPSDLKLLLSRIFDNITKQNTLDRTINSKKVEDFSVSFNHSSITMSDTLWQSLLKDNASVISKYSLCDIPNVQHGGGC
jgi:hypothetical protein